MKHIFSINLFSLFGVAPCTCAVGDPPPCTDPPACICPGEGGSTLVIMADTGNPDGCGCGQTDNNNPACDAPMFSCDTDICNPEDTCNISPPRTYDYPCLRLDKCGIDWSFCWFQDRCDSDNPCGAPDTEGQPID